MRELTERLRGLDREFVWHPFTPMGLWERGEALVVERGEGVYLWDTEGRRYIDGVSSLWCNVHGHRHGHIDAAVRGQLEKIAHSTLLGLVSGPSAELARRLIGLWPGEGGKVFYSDSGAAAVEVAIKMAVQYWRIKGEGRRTKFVALGDGYHGDTVGAVSVGSIELFHRIFGALTFETYYSDSPGPYRFAGTSEECREAALGSMEAVLAEHGEEVAAVVVEPLVQGAAGLVVHPEGFLKGVERLARRYGVLLIVDEVATGFGRTGTMFACEQEGVRPDLMCLGKGITGGYLPVAATLASEGVYEAFRGEPWRETTFYHGHTYTGNALGCAAAVASLEVFEREGTLERLGGRIARLHEWLGEVAELEYVGDARHRGMMAGIELVADKGSKASFAAERRTGARVCEALRGRGVLLRPLGDLVVVMPPLSISEGELEELLGAVGETLREDLPGLAVAEELGTATGGP